MRRTTRVVLALVATMLLGGGLLGGGVLRASSFVGKERVVTAYFAALDWEDYGGALRHTVGQAHDLTERIVGELQRQSAARHIRVDIATRRIEVQSPCQGPVKVRFDIDVLGRFAFFRKKVKTISGEATFAVDNTGYIAEISGDLGL